MLVLDITKKMRKKEEKMNEKKNKCMYTSTFDSDFKKENAKEERILHDFLLLLFTFQRESIYTHVEALTYVQQRICL